MIIEVLEIQPNGDQTIVQKEVPDNYLDVMPLPEPDPPLENYLVDLDFRLSLIELGVI
ncbi:MAG: hypothetical protein AB9835_14580 [Eubacteriales bacterium]